MKKPSDDLFNLVKSLDGNEKSFIKRCLQNELNHSVFESFFDYLYSASDSNENTIFSKFKKINSGTIKYYKKTLFNFILKTLDQYHEEATVEQRLYRTLFQIRILRKRNLFARANKLLKLSIEEANKSGFFLLEVQLLAEQQFNCIASEENHKYKKLKTKISKAQEFLFNNYHEYHKNNEFIQELKALRLKEGFHLLNENKNIVEAIYNETLNKKRNLLEREKSAFINLQEKYIKYFSLLLTDQYDGAKLYFEDFLSTYENFNARIIDPEEYLWHINCGIALSIFIQDKSLAYNLEDKAEIFVNSISEKAKDKAVMRNYFSIKVNIIALLTEMEEFKEASEYAEKFQHKNLHNYVDLGAVKVFLVNLCQSYLCNGEIKKALYCYNAIMNSPEFKRIRADVDYAMSIHGLAIFYELNSFEYVVSLIRGLKRKKDFSLNNYIYKELINFFSELNRPSEKKEVKFLFEEILKKIKEINKDDHESIVFLRNSQIYSWLKKKHNEI